MAEPHKNHLNIDGAQAKQDENIASYKPIPETDRGIFFALHYKYEDFLEMSSNIIVII